MSQVQRYRNRLIVAVIAIFLLGQATAQDLDPRRYTNIPVGQNFMALAFVYSEGDVNFSSSIPLSDA
jgi:hypothetical protein